jgi:uncharacterized protein (TIGR03083 family)
MVPIQPIDVRDRFVPLYDRFFELVSGLSSAEWDFATVCDGWSVKDIADHLLGGDIGLLSRQRDGYFGAQPAQIASWEALVHFIDDQNDQWVRATQRISPQLLSDLFRVTAPQVIAHFAARDLNAIGNPVSWAGPEPAPIWLDVAREYTERWHHQQQMREAVGAPGITDAWLFHPVIDTFMRALPHTFRHIAAPEGTSIVVLVSDTDSDLSWSLRREDQHWRLYAGEAPMPQAQVRLPADTTWRLVTKGISTNTARNAATIDGDAYLADPVLTMISIIA